MSSSSAQHRRNTSLDPFSDPDVYYGDEDNIARMRDRKRAFSSVRPDSIAPPKIS